MSTSCDKEALRQAYESVRDDKSDVNWAIFRYDGNTITLDGTGVDFAEFSSKFKDEERQYGYLRMITGDELSKRAKFAFVTWIGPSVSALKRARVSIDKALVKEVISNFAVEIAASDPSDLDESNIREQLIKAGGANYGTGGSK